MIEVNTTLLEEKLDKARIKLHVNMSATSKSRAKTWREFIKEVNELKEVLKDIPEDAEIPCYGV